MSSSLRLLRDFCGLGRIALNLNGGGNRDLVRVDYLCPLREKRVRSCKTGPAEVPVGEPR
jgi:hypothetical protein